MINEAQRRVLETIELPEVLQTMLDRNTIGWIDRCYEVATPTEAALQREVKEFYDKAMNNLDSTFATNEIERQDRMLGYTDNLFFPNLQWLHLSLSVKASHFTSFIAFFQLSNAVSEETRTEWLARIEADKLRLQNYINTLVTNVERDYRDERERRLQAARYVSPWKRVKRIFTPAT
jgi:hypothetical protein